MKRLFDLVASVSLLVILALPLLVLGLLVRRHIGRPIFFRQVRAGMGGRPFVMFKFRTMADSRSHDGSLLPDEMRLTPFGRILRSSSLDELPELINVLKGEMSLVGPRPLLVEYLPLYSPDQFRRHEVRPGITGWAQVNGRNAIDWKGKFRLDVWYVDNQTFWLDLRILGITAIKVFRRENINAAGDAMMPVFRGNDGE